MVTSISESRAAQQPFQQHISLDMLNSYRVELAQDLLDDQGQLIDWLIDFAFDTLGTRVLDLRIVPPEHERICNSLYLEGATA
jgi:hypothetical protein